MLHQIANPLFGLSIIIPTFNEADNIGKLIDHLKKGILANDEIIICDAGSEDYSDRVASEHGAIVVKAPKGRSIQMNRGAAVAKNEILYFVHADTLPPPHFKDQIFQAIQSGFSLGRFRTRFDSKSVLLKMNAFLTRFDWFICCGGDQSLFITRKVFDSIYGYDENLLLMEDYDIVKRARLNYKYKILKASMLISARKYHTNGWLKVQLAHYKILQMYKAGISQERIFQRYRQLLNYRY
ncbi:TIGR04283 family arsenosugar biosynthesis glycosyltransferase [soil metagenome]